MTFKSEMLKRSLRFYDLKVKNVKKTSFRFYDLLVGNVKGVV